MNDFVEIGVYGDATANPLCLRKHRIRSGRQTVSVVVKGGRRAAATIRACS